jgi:transcriptional regulator with XRE-family HTH domain
MTHTAGTCPLISADISPPVLFLRRFGKRLTLLRAAAGLTEEELADAAGMDRTGIAMVERGQTGIDIDYLHDLADVLGVTVRDLMPKNDPPSPRDPEPRPEELPPP